jgi:hypothetical protein
MPVKGISNIQMDGIYIKYSITVAGYAVQFAQSYRGIVLNVHTK